MTLLVILIVVLCLFVAVGLALELGDWWEHRRDQQSRERWENHWR